MATTQYINHLLILNGAFFSSSCFSRICLGEWRVDCVGCDQKLQLVVTKLNIAKTLF